MSFAFHSLLRRMARVQSLIDGEQRRRSPNPLALLRFKLLRARLKQRMWAALRRPATAGAKAPAMLSVV